MKDKDKEKRRNLSFVDSMQHEKTSFPFIFILPKRQTSSIILSYSKGTVKSKNGLEKNL